MDYLARPRCPSRDWRLVVAGRFLAAAAADAVLVATPASVSLFAIEELGGGEDRLVPVCRLETLARVVALASVRGEGGRDLSAVLFENGRLALLRYDDLELRVADEVAALPDDPADPGAELAAHWGGRLLVASSRAGELAALDVDAGADRLAPRADPRLAALCPGRRGPADADAPRVGLHFLADDAPRPSDAAAELCRSEGLVMPCGFGSARVVAATDAARFDVRGYDSPGRRAALLIAARSEHTAALPICEMPPWWRANYAAAPALLRLPGWGVRAAGLGGAPPGSWLAAPTGRLPNGAQGYALPEGALSMTAHCWRGKGSPLERALVLALESGVLVEAQPPGYDSGAPGYDGAPPSARLVGRLDERVAALAAAPGGRHLVAVTGNRTVILLRRGADGRYTAADALPSASPVAAAARAPGGGALLLACRHDAAPPPAPALAAELGAAGAGALPAPPQGALCALRTCLAPALLFASGGGEAVGATGLWALSRGAAAGPESSSDASSDSAAAPCDLALLSFTNGTRALAAEGAVLCDVTDALRGLDAGSRTLAAGALAPGWAAQATPAGAHAFAVGGGAAAGADCAGAAWRPAAGERVDVAAVSKNVVLLHCAAGAARRLVALALDAGAGALSELASAACGEDFSCLSNIVAVPGAGAGAGTGDGTERALLFAAGTYGAAAQLWELRGGALRALGEVALGAAAAAADALWESSGGGAPDAAGGWEAAPRSPLAAARAGAAPGGAAIAESALLAALGAAEAPSGAAAALELLLTLRSGDAVALRLGLAADGRLLPPAAAARASVALGATPAALVSLPRLPRAAPGFAAAAISRERVALLRGPAPGGAALRALPLDVPGVAHAAALLLPATAAAGAPLRLLLLCATEDGRVLLFSLEAHDLRSLEAAPLPFRPTALAAGAAAPGLAAVAGLQREAGAGPGGAGAEAPRLALLGAEGEALGAPVAELRRGALRPDEEVTALVLLEESEWLLPAEALEAPPPLGTPGGRCLLAAATAVAGASYAEEEAGEPPAVRGRVLLLEAATPAGGGAPRLELLHALSFASPVSALCAGEAASPPAAADPQLFAAVGRHAVELFVSATPPGLRLSRTGDAPTARCAAALARTPRGLLIADGVDGAAAYLWRSALQEGSAPGEAAPPVLEFVAADALPRPAVGAAPLGAGAGVAGAGAATRGAAWTDGAVAVLDAHGGLAVLEAAPGGGALLEAARHNLGEAGAALLRGGLGAPPRGAPAPAALAVTAGGGGVELRPVARGAAAPLAARARALAADACTRLPGAPGLPTDARAVARCARLDPKTGRAARVALAPPRPEPCAPPPGLAEANATALGAAALAAARADAALAAALDGDPIAEAVEEAVAHVAAAAAGPAVARAEDYPAAELAARLAEAAAAPAPEPGRAPPALRAAVLDGDLLARALAAPPAALAAAAAAAGLPDAAAAVRAAADVLLL